MILMDFSQVVISTVLSEIGTRKNVHLDSDLLRHMIINTIRSYHKKYKPEFGDLVIACDGKNYWRRKVFPNYKAMRKRDREASGIDWNVIFDTLSSVRNDIDAFFPYKVINVEGAEADDIVATLCEWSQENYVKETLFDAEPKPILILSGDRDFVQLQKFKNVKQYSPILKKFLVADKDPSAILLEHILRGDKGDGVPNVLSNDDSIVNGERQKPLSTKNVEKWINSPSEMPSDDTFKRNFHRNKALVDLSMIPEEIKQGIISQFVDKPFKDRSHLLNYFIKHKMKNMLEVVGDF